MQFYETITRYSYLGFTTNTHTALRLIRPQSVHCYAVMNIALQLFAIIDWEVNTLLPDLVLFTSNTVS